MIKRDGFRAPGALDSVSPQKPGSVTLGTPTVPRPISVVFLNRTFPPDVAATGQLLSELSSSLSSMGIQVTVVTARPPGLGVRSEQSHGTRVERVWSLPFTRASHMRRALSYLSLYPSLFWKAVNIRRTDVIVTMTDPPLISVLGIVLAWFTGATSIHWTQDIYPDIAEELGLLPRKSLIARLLKRLSEWSLSHQSKVVCVGRCMRDKLLQKGVSADRISVIPNWSDQGGRRPTDEEINGFRKRHQMAGRKIVMYSGNLGLAHPLEPILDAAEILGKSAPDILFVFIGGGPKIAWLKSQIAARGMKNIRSLPPQPKDTLPISLRSADLHIACMHNNLLGLVVPSKVYGILNVGQPCIFIGPARSEVALLVNQANCGTVISNPAGTQLAECIDQWLSNPKRLKEAGRRASDAVADMGRESATRQFAELLIDSISSPER